MFPRRDLGAGAEPLAGRRGRWSVRVLVVSVAVAVAVALAGTLIGISAVPAAANLANCQYDSVTHGYYCYAGYDSSSTYLGIDGSIDQSTTGTVSSPAHHADWINVCGNGSCMKWVQLGEFQGTFPLIQSPSAVHVYSENTDQCGRLTEVNDGAPAVNWQMFYLTYDGSGSHNQTCPNGNPSTFYVYEFRTGSFTSVPIYYGQIPDISGTLFDSTEIYPDQTVPLHTDYFGCESPPSDCDTHAHAIHTYNGAFALWTYDYTARTSGNPPYRDTFNSAWSFKTCPSTC